MQSSKSSLVNLVIDGEPMTEIYLIDGGMRRVASGVGRIEVDVAPGLYKIRSRKAGVEEDRLVEVTDERERQLEHAPEIKTHTSAPLLQSLTSHEFHAYPAEDLSRRVHQTVDGPEAELFIFVRDENADPGQGTPWELPLDSVSVRRLTGEMVADLSVGKCDRNAGFVGATLAVPAATWRVRVDTEPLGTYELFVTTVSGWQTQVFLALDDFYYEGRQVRRPSLRSATILMGRQSEGFDPNSRDAELVMNTSTALAFERNLLPCDAWDEMVYGKWRDPLLGVYALHVSLLDGVSDSARVILKNLTELLGKNHPDVQALWCRIEPSEVPRDIVFENPPLLYHSWQSLLRSSRENNRCIPAGGGLSILAENFLNAKPWLIHRVPESETSPASAVSLAHAERTLGKLLELSGSSQAKFRNLLQSRPASLSNLEVQILQNTLDQQSIKETLTATTSRIRSTSNQARRIFQQLPAPGYTVAMAVEKLASRMNVASED